MDRDDRTASSRGRCRGVAAGGVRRASTTAAPACSLTVPRRRRGRRPSGRDTTSTWPSRRAPSFTGTCSTLSSAPTRNTKPCSASCCTASLRQHQRLRAAAAAPARAAACRGAACASGFGNSARTRTARVCGSTRLSMSAMRPSKFAPGHASLARGDRLARRQRRQRRFGHGEVELDRAVVVERGDHRARRHQRAEADLAQAEHAGERRGDRAVGDRRALRPAALAAAASRLARRVSYWPRASSCALASSPPRRSCCSASRNAASAAATSACCARLFMSASSCPARTRWPLSNASRVHHVADLGGDRHRFARLRRAQRLQAVAARAAAARRVVVTVAGASLRGVAPCRLAAARAPRAPARSVAASQRGTPRERRVWTSSSHLECEPRILAAAA